MSAQNRGADVHPERGGSRVAVGGDRGSQGSALLQFKAETKGGSRQDASLTGSSNYTGKTDRQALFMVQAMIEDGQLDRNDTARIQAVYNSAVEARRRNRAMRQSEKSERLSVAHSVVADVDNKPSTPPPPSPRQGSLPWDVDDRKQPHVPQPKGETKGVAMQAPMVQRSPPQPPHSSPAPTHHPACMSTPAARQPQPTHTHQTSVTPRPAIPNARTPVSAGIEHVDAIAPPPLAKKEPQHGHVRFAPQRQLAANQGQHGAMTSGMDRDGNGKSQRYGRFEREGTLDQTPQPSSARATSLAIRLGEGRRSMARDIRGETPEGQYLDQKHNEILRLCVDMLARPPTGVTGPDGKVRIPRVSSPTPYNGDDLASEFFGWLMGLLTFFRGSFLTGDDHDELRLGEMEKALEGKALRWYRATIQKDRIRGKGAWSFESTLFAMYDHFVHPRLMAQREAEYERLAYNKSTGIEAFYDDLCNARDELMEPPDPVSFNRRFFDALPERMRVYIAIECSCSPNWSTSEDILRAGLRHEQSRMIVKQSCLRQAGVLDADDMDDLAKLNEYYSSSEEEQDVIDHFEIDEEEGMVRGDSDPEYRLPGEGSEAEGEHTSARK
ncbi:hypothetical protein NMY22_g10626 [Coprinellus aureogranulatus]|nr:hypothetical protein NMY22_g10626 [Coprinellus aureogranulatus]